jgi:hypothetical protein
MFQMKYPFLLFLLGLFLCQCTLAQKGKYPRNLKSAVKILMVDCPDSLKNLIVKTKTDSLIYLCNPWGGKYNTINEWFINGETLSPIDKYLIKKGLYKNYEQQSIVMAAFKRKLVDGKVNQRLILMQYENHYGKRINRRKQLKVRYSSDTWKGKYIPKDIDDAIIQLDFMISDSAKAKFKDYNENEFSVMCHLTLGRHIRNDWQLWNGSRLTKYFNGYGIYNAEDMSWIIIKCYLRHLQMKEINLNQQIQECVNYKKEAQIKENEKKKICFAEYLLGDTVELITTRSLNRKKAIRVNNNCHPKGIVVSKKQEGFIIKVKLIEACETRRIAYYIFPGDELNKKNATMCRHSLNRNRENIYFMRKGQMKWFRYDYWNLRKNIRCQ